MAKGPVKSAKQKLEDEIAKLNANIENYNQKIAEYEQKIEDAKATIEEKKKELTAENSKEIVDFLTDRKIDYDQLVKIIETYKDTKDTPAEE